jgi:flavin reductase (DIM6/NTAB) family NADH-FMN oxidoreductase RutF
MTSKTEEFETKKGPTVDPFVMRSAMGRFATGVTIVTNAEGERVHGMTANAFMSVSLEPPLVLVSLGKQARMTTILSESDTYGVSILANSQESVARLFAGPKHPMRPPEFEWLGGVPVIAGSLVQLKARIIDRHEAGDHILFIGQVENLEVRDGQPLLFHTGAFKLAQVAVSEPYWES